MLRSSKVCRQSFSGQLLRLGDAGLEQIGDHAFLPAAIGAQEPKSSARETVDVHAHANQRPFFWPAFQRADEAFIRLRYQLIPHLTQADEGFVRALERWPKERP